MKQDKARSSSSFYKFLNANGWMVTIAQFSSILFYSVAIIVLIMVASLIQKWVDVTTDEVFPDKWMFVKWAGVIIVVAMVVFVSLLGIHLWADRELRNHDPRHTELSENIKDAFGNVSTNPIASGMSVYQAPVSVTPVAPAYGSRPLTTPRSGASEGTLTYAQIQRTLDAKTRRPYSAV